MKKLLAAFLVFLMLTPALVCAMPICADASTPQLQMPYENHSGHTSHNEGHSKITFMADCMGVDLQIADIHDLANQPDLQKDQVIFETIYDLSAPSQDLVSARNIHGPPPWVAVVAATYPPIYLNTQRLRI